MSQMTPELMLQLDVRAALVAELEHMPDLLPKQLVDIAVLGHEDMIAGYISELAQAGANIEPASNVVALKWRHGRRTVAALPLHERVLYRAVVQSLQPDLVSQTRGKEAFDDFQNSPLQHPDVGYVVMTDIANFYSSIDLNRLAEELLRRTGRWAQVNWLREFWGITSDGFGGIPQMNPSSDLIGDTYADRLHRALLRKGFATWRYADDFRIACKTYGDCVAVLEEMDDLARQLGLALNERKTLTPSVEKYREFIEGPERRLERINAEVTEDLTGFDSYAWVEVTPEEAEVLQESAARVMGLWMAEHGDAATDEGAVDMVQVLPQTLLVLGVSQNDSALAALPLLLRYEPQLTPVVCRYLRLLAQSKASEVGRSIADCLSVLTLTKWQRLWLLHVLEDVPVYSSGDNADLVPWMEQQARDPLIALRCQAAWSLARSYSLGLQEWEGLLTSGSRYAAPFAAASVRGIANLTTDQKAALAPTGIVEGVVSNWSSSQPFLPPF